MLDKLVQSPLAESRVELALDDAAFKLPLPSALLNALRKVSNLRVLHLSDVFPPWTPAGFFTAPADFPLPNSTLNWNLNY